MCFFVVKKDKKWKLYLFYNGILIKKIKLKDNENIQQPRYIRVIGHKEIFNKWLVGVMVTPIKLLKTDEVNKITYWGVIDEKGEEIK